MGLKELTPLGESEFIPEYNMNRNAKQIVRLVMTKNKRSLLLCPTAEAVESRRRSTSVPLVAG